jgi:hypothetical protein
LGPGIPLYLEFAFLSFYFLLAFGVFSSLPSFVINQLDSDEQDEIIRFSSLSKFSRLYRELRLFTTLAALIVMLILLRVFRRKQTASSIKFDDSLVSAADFTIMIIGLPAEEHTNEEIKDLVMTHLTKIYLKKDYSSMIKIERIVTARDIRQKLVEIKKLNKQVNYRRKFFLRNKLEKDKKEANTPRRNRSQKLTQEHQKNNQRETIVDEPLIISQPNRNHEHQIYVQCDLSATTKQAIRLEPNKEASGSRFLSSDPRLFKASESMNFRPSGVVFVTLSKQEGR